MLTTNHAIRSSTNVDGIREVKPGLYTTVATAPNGVILYLGYELMTSQEQVNFWNGYKKALMPKGAGYMIAGFIRDAFFNNETLPTYPHSYSAAFESESAYLEVQEKFNEKKLYNLDFKMIAADAVKFLKPELSSEQTSNYIVYASKEPIADYRWKKPMRKSEIDEVKHKELLERNGGLNPGYRIDDPSQYLDFIKNYGDILMCVGAHTAKNSPSVTHMGIFRNFADYLSPGDQYSNISLILHGFGARVGIEILQKQFLVFQPLNKMSEILQNKVGKEKIIRANQNDAKERLREHFVNKGLEYPEDLVDLETLLHYDRTLTGAVMLIDLDELTRFAFPPGNDAVDLLQALKRKDWSKVKVILELDENVTLYQVAWSSIRFAMKRNLLGIIPEVVTDETGIDKNDTPLENMMYYASKCGKLDHLKEFLALPVPIATNGDVIECIFKSAVIQNQTNIVSFFLQANKKQVPSDEYICGCFCYVFKEGYQDQINLFLDWVNNAARFNQLCNKVAECLTSYDISLGFKFLAKIYDKFNELNQNNYSPSHFQREKFDIEDLNQVRLSLSTKIYQVLADSSTSSDEKNEIKDLYENCFTKGNAYYDIFGANRIEYIDKMIYPFGIAYSH